MAQRLWHLEQISKNGLNGQTRLNNVTVDIASGVTAVLGPSGAGKSTLLNLIAGFEKPDSGVVTCLAKKDGHALDFYWVPQDAGLWPNLTVKEHLRLVNSKLGDSSIDTLLGQFDIADKESQLPGHLSKGEGARLAIARALAADPSVLIMDEPLAHVDASRRNDIWKFLLEHVCKLNVSLVFATHNSRDVIADADSVICVKFASVVYTGNVKDLYYRPSSGFMAAFLGEYNWFEPAEAKTWLGCNALQAFCVRPEDLEVTASDNSLVVIGSVRFSGSCCELELFHIAERKKKVFFVRHSTKDLGINQHVTLKASR